MTLIFSLKIIALAASALRRGGANDGGVLAAVRAEIAHELSSSTPSSAPSLQSQVPTTACCLAPKSSATHSPLVLAGHS